MAMTVIVVFVLGSEAIFGSYWYFFFSEINWNAVEAPASSTGEDFLRAALQRLLPNSTPLLNYRHPDLVHTSGFKMELDVYYDELKIAFEFQGRQHYRDCYRGNFQQQLLRDAEKQHACNTRNITLILVPFWWDLSHVALGATIHDIRPDVSLSVPVDEHTPRIPKIEPRLQRLIDKVNLNPASVFIPVGKYENMLDPTATYVQLYAALLLQCYYDDDDTVNISIS